MRRGGDVRYFERGVGADGCGAETESCCGLCHSPPLVACSVCVFVVENTPGLVGLLCVSALCACSLSVRALCASTGCPCVNPTPAVCVCETCERVCVCARARARERESERARERESALSLERVLFL